MAPYHSIRDSAQCTAEMVATRENSAQIQNLARELTQVFSSQAVEQAISIGRTFAPFLLEAKQRHRAKKLALMRATNGPPDDIVYWIAQAQDQGDLDEALWRAFLAGHFGRPSADEKSIASATRLLCAFGEIPKWTWKRATDRFFDFKDWLFEHKAELRNLQFANHRKFESQKPNNLLATISSFVDWVRNTRGTPRKAFEANLRRSPEESFRSLYQTICSEWRQFNRLGAFDTLTFIGHLGLMPIRADSCYLEGATGPLKGAHLIWGKRPESDLSRLADEAARTLRIPYEAFEDALCWYQK